MFFQLKQVSESITSEKEGGGGGEEGREGGREEKKGREEGRKGEGRKANFFINVFHSSPFSCSVSSPLPRSIVHVINCDISGM